MDTPSDKWVISLDRGHARGWLILLALLWIASLAATWFLSSRPAGQAPAPTAGSSVTPVADGVGNADLKQQVSTLKRSDQISRNANIELQSTLAEREEEISGLRADVAFYERLVGSTGQRQGLRVHEAKFSPQGAGTWHYTVTLTQNLNRGSISKGGMRFSVDGVRGGKLSTIRWDELLQKPGAPPKPFSFRYFQQLDDSVMLPPGFTPQRVRVSLDVNGKAVDQTFAWDASKP
jgi:hypothetical protein